MAANNGTAMTVHQAAVPVPAAMQVGAALEPTSIDQGIQCAEFAAKSGLFGIKSREEAFTRMAIGMGLGLGAWQSLRGLYVINGKVGMYADMMTGLCMRSPDCEYFMLVESSDTVATYEAKRKSHPKPTRLSFTLDDAKRAGLVTNAMYGKYPPAMLRARCTAALARIMFPETLHGIYLPEELDPDRERQPQRVEVEHVSAPLASVLEQSISNVVDSQTEEAAMLEGKLRLAAEQGDTDEVERLAADARDTFKGPIRKRVAEMFKRYRAEAAAVAQRRDEAAQVEEEDAGQ